MLATRPAVNQNIDLETKGSVDLCLCDLATPGHPVEGQDRPPFTSGQIDKSLDRKSATWVMDNET